MKLVLTIFVASLLLAGCTKPSEPSVPEQDAQGRYVIHLTAANRFTPADAKIPINSTVVWVNDGGVHDVTARDGSWKSPRAMPVGASYEHKFESAGKVDYHCELHASQGMKGTLQVG